MEDLHSSPAPPATVLPALRLFRHLPIEPCEGKILWIPVFPAEPKFSEPFVGRALVQYRPHRPENRQYEYKGPMPAKCPKERFQTLVRSYTLELLRSIKTTKCEGCSTLKCDVCTDTVSLRKQCLAMGRNPGDHSVSDRLAKSLHLFLLDGLELYKWSPDLAAWMRCRKDILELCMLAGTAGFGKHRRSWEPVFEAHATLACGGRMAGEEDNKRWFKNEMRDEREKPVEDLRNGRYEDTFVYFLFSDEAQTSMKSIDAK